MVRPCKCRTVRKMPRALCFKPAGIPLSDLEQVTLTIDECEALRLADMEGLYHLAAAEKMNISRQTFGNIIASARHKAADALCRGKALRIEGGVIDLCPRRVICRGHTKGCACPKCKEGKAANINSADKTGEPL